MKRANPLEEWLALQAGKRNREALEPIPATRNLGDQFGVSHATAFRLLCRFEKEGKVWRHPNGRFYPGFAGRILGQPKPFAVMLRKMNSWSSLCRSVMEGFSEACGARERNLLLLYNKSLLNQSTPGGPIEVSAVEHQRELLEDFTLLHGEQIDGVLLDELWSDAALSELTLKGLRGVVFFRQSRVPEIGNVAADFQKGALLALRHLRDRGYEEIYLLNPFPDYLPARQFITAAKATYRALFGRPFPPQWEILLSVESQQKAFIESLAQKKARCGMVCPEDNMSLQFAATLLERNIPLGQTHGLISAMGTAQAAARLTTVRYDFVQMGRLAAEMLCEGTLGRVKIQPWLSQGSST